MKRLLNAGCGQRAHADWINLDLQAPPGGVSANLRNGLPFRDGVFTAVYHSHVLEHLPQEQAGTFLRECHRVIEAGGILRVGVPDLEAIARLYLEKLQGAMADETHAEADYDWIMLEMYDQAVRERSGGAMAAYLSNPRIPHPEFVIERIGEEGRGIMESAARSRSGSAAAAAPAPSAADVGRFRRCGEVHLWMYDRFSLGRALSQAGFLAPTVARAGESAIPGFRSHALELDRAGQLRKPDTLFMEARKPS